MPTLLVLGAGYVGQEVLRRGHEGGFVCCAVSRRSLAQDAKATWLSGDVTSRESLFEIRRQSGPVDLLVYAVSPSASIASDASAEAAYGGIYGRGVDNALTAFPEARFVLVSSTRVYGRSHDGVIDDHTAAQPDDESGEQIALGESRVLAQGPENVVLRASGIYGPGRTRTARALLSEPLSPDERHLVTNRIHRDDLVRIAFFLENRALGGTFVASDPNPTPLGVLQDELRRIAAETGFTAAPVGTRPSRRSGARVLTPSRLLELGFEFQFPSFREGYRSIFSGEEELRRKKESASDP